MMLRNRCKVDIKQILTIWIDRHNGRNQLAKFTNRELEDIGVTRFDAYQEIKKAFWKK